MGGKGLAFVKSSLVHLTTPRTGSLPPAGVTYTYDGDGKRVKKSNGKLYWTGVGSDPLAETDLAGNNPTEFVFFNGKRTARRDPSGTIEYYFSDHLGSADVITNATGTIVDESDYYPFGGERVIIGGDPNQYKFTGKERDAESGLDFFGARYYSSSLGRWTSPDWSTEPQPIPYADLGDPRSLNLYSYVRNNPIANSDADGHDCPVCPDVDLESVRQLIDKGTEAGKQLIKAAPAAGPLAAATAVVVGTFYWADTAITDAYVANNNDDASLAAQESRTAGENREKEQEAQPQSGGAGARKTGGTYLLEHPETGEVMRTGQTNDVNRRKGEHARGETTKDLRFTVDKKSNSREARLGREQMIHEKHRPPLNKRNPIAPANPNKPRYLRKGKKL